MEEIKQENKKLICKICINKKSKQKYITIPKSSSLVSGDYVEVVRC